MLKDTDIALAPNFPSDEGHKRLEHLHRVMRCMREVVYHSSTEALVIPRLLVHIQACPPLNHYPDSAGESITCKEVQCHFLCGVVEGHIC